MAKFDRCEEKEAFWGMVLVLDEHRGSSLNIRQFCKREGLGEASFYFGVVKLTIAIEDATR